MKNYVPENHHRYVVIPEVMKIADVLKESVDFVNFSGYGCQYDNGNGIDLSACKEWAENYYAKYLFNSNNTKKRLQIGCNYWKQNKQQPLTIIMEDARANFNVDARIEFVCRDEVKKCYHLYSFYSDRKNADRAYSFYGMHSAKLIRFIAYFNQEATHLIAEANKPENLIAIPDYTPPPLPEKTRNFVTEMKAVAATYDLGDRETEVMVLYAAGCSAKQIAEMFNRSLCTVETHITRIYKKTGCKDRKDLNIYVRNLGLTGMERFFFSYFSH